MDDVTTQVRDPVCSMIIDSDKAADEREVNGTRYFFCSDACAAEFDRDPEAYVEEIEAD